MHSSIKIRPVREISTRTLYLVFLISGIAAIIYQLAWQRSLFVIFGSNWESITIIITAFLLGLGVGGYLGGMMSLSKRVQPAVQFGILEVLVALFGLVSMQTIAFIGSQTPTIGVFAAGITSFVLLLIPTVCMGATLPLLVSHLLERQPQIGATVGYLYFANTLGAGMGCFYTASFLFGSLGLQQSVWFAAALDAAVGLIVLSHVFPRPKEQQ